eukprot:TRINITY_DN9532_c0_g1_i3.p1 TRINITY_DN9532_c0_g1~~TRINITY_DN9532_c0_g1_i3.p1  ORF type:complete len:572 (+),score=118.94 TRINITY_DN9532_c0_g1_i3:66-1718(+)
MDARTTYVPLSGSQPPGSVQRVRVEGSTPRKRSTSGPNFDSASIGFGDGALVPNAAYESVQSGGRAIGAMAVASSLRLEVVAEAGVCFVSLSLLITIIGTGVLTMPAAAARLGTLGFPLVMMLCGMLFAHSIYLTARNLDLCGPRRGSNMAELGRAALNSFGFWLATLLCFADSWGALMSSFRVIGDLVTVLAHNAGCDWLGPDVAIIGAFVLAYPTTLPGTMYGARFSTVIALLAVGFLIGLLWYMAVTRGDIEYLERQPAFYLDGGALRAIPVVLYSFDCQANCYPLFRELNVKPPKARSFAKVGFSAISMAAVLYWLSGMAGVSAFTSDVPHDVLAAMPSGPVIVMVQVAVSLSTFCLLPITAFELTVILRQYVFPAAKLGRFGSVALSNLLTLSTSALVAIRVRDAYDAFAITGAVAVTALTFVLPPLFFLVLTRTPHAHIPKPSAALQELPMVHSSAEMAFGESQASGDDDDELYSPHHARTRTLPTVGSYGSIARSPKSQRSAPSVRFGGAESATKLERLGALLLLIFGTVSAPILLWIVCLPA